MAKKPTVSPINLGGIPKKNLLKKPAKAATAVAGKAAKPAAAKAGTQKVTAKDTKKKTQRAAPGKGKSAKSQWRRKQAAGKTKKKGKK